MAKSASRDWLSIREASRFLGVHIGTMRDWADAGKLPSYRTPGGHRRFSTSDLQTFLQQQKQNSKTSALSPAERAIGIVRHELHDHAPWLEQLGIAADPERRAHQREFGQRLLACVIAFGEEPQRHEFFLAEGRRTAREYGRLLVADNISAGNAARATIHFRQLILKTVLELKLGSRKGDEEDARLFQRVSAFLDEILLAILDAYR